MKLFCKATLFVVLTVASVSAQAFYGYIVSTKGDLTLVAPCTKIERWRGADALARLLSEKGALNCVKVSGDWPATIRCSSPDSELVQTLYVHESMERCEIAQRLEPGIDISP
jgi:hypothetical protein